METLDCIAKRCSIRKYEKYTIKDDEVKAILKAGMEAPSAMNRRPYELVINRNNAFFKDFVLAKPTAAILATSSLTVLIVGDSNKNPTMEFMIEDGSLVAENMLLAATDLGLASLWAGVKFDSDFAKQLISYFKLPDGYYPLAVLCFGKAGEKKVQVDRYDLAKIHEGKF
jgi:nitroreductase